MFCFLVSKNQKFIQSNSFRRWNVILGTTIYYTWILSHHTRSTYFCFVLLLSVGGCLVYLVTFTACTMRNFIFNYTFCKICIVSECVCRDKTCVFFFHLYCFFSLNFFFFGYSMGFILDLKFFLYYEFLELLLCGACECALFTRSIEI